MDDEEEDMSQPISQPWGTPCGDIKYEDRTTQIAAGQAPAAARPTSQSHNNNSISINTRPCIMHRQPHIPFHDDRMAERPEEQAGVSVEAQIGQKLREIGDKFHQDHVELFMRHHRQNLPVWMRLTMALFGFLFPRQAVIPGLRGEQR
ncbi:hypothetical protein PAMP_014225 [Pampus punctatissimus]